MYVRHDLQHWIKLETEERRCWPDARLCPSNRCIYVHLFLCQSAVKLGMKAPRCSLSATGLGLRHSGCVRVLLSSWQPFEIRRSRRLHQLSNIEDSLLEYFISNRGTEVEPVFRHNELFPSSDWLPLPRLLLEGWVSKIYLWGDSIEVSQVILLFVYVVQLMLMSTK